MNTVIPTPVATDQTATLENEFTLKEKAESHNVNFEIAGLTFDILSAPEIVKYSAVRVTHPGMYSVGGAGSGGKPLPHGPMDLHLGANRADRETGRCQTCGGGWDECSGHWGYVKLPVPVFHVGYFKWILAILYCICKDCGSLLLDPVATQRYLNRMKRLADDVIRKKVVFKQIVAECKKITICPVCEKPQGMLRRINQGTPDKFMKIQHEIKMKDPSGRLTVVREDLTPLILKHLLQKVSSFHCQVLDITRPERLILDHFPVPPSAIRPSINLGDAGINEDDLSATLRDIVQCATVIDGDINDGMASHIALAHQETLQMHCAKFINSDYPQLEAALNSLDRSGSGGKIGRGVAQRLKGKEGRFRCNLSGKRVDFSGRTVISPDPNCPIPCVVVPEWSARRLTFPERVCAFNMERLRAAVLNGPDQWPGALTVEKKKDGFKTSLKFVNRRQVAASLEIGDLVERHMQDDDAVLFNRQPSLHRMSIMAHRARVMPWRTLRFNECVCSPYNADFDGDEMNCHLPQTQEAKAEALYLMGVTNNLITPKNGEPLVAATQDFLSGSWMICHKDTFLTRDKMTLFCCYFSDGLYQIDLPPPALLKPVELWTGKQLFSTMIRPNRDAKVILNFELKERDFGKPRPGEPKFMCPRDGYIVFHRSELMCGACGKAVLGGGSKDGLFFHLIRDNNPQIAAEIMGRVAKLTGRWFANRGMTIGIDDVTPSDLITREKWKLINRGYDKVKALTDQYNKGQLTPDPGCTVEETLENKSKAVLDDLRNENGKMAVDTLHPLNKPLIMFLSGAKGAIINMAQMIALVGQQNVNGKRIWNGFVKRTLPHYGPHQVNSPKAKGFVANSFYTGLEPDEFFFHTMSGREGLVDTAVKTADTGYMQRRISKALEDLSLKYDRTVRTSNAHIVQFVYGDDGLNPQLMEGETGLVDLGIAFNHSKSVSPARLDIIHSPLAVASRSKRYSSPANADGVSISSMSKRLRIGTKLAVASVENSDTETETDGEQAGSAGNSNRLDATAVPRIDDADVILPPPTDLGVLQFVREYLADEEGKGLPKSIRQKVKFLHTHLRHQRATSDAAKTAVELLGGPTVDSSQVDPMWVQVREHLVAHTAVWRWLPPVKRESPLFPYEVLQWSQWLIKRTKELQPESISDAFNLARKEKPTHQPRTAQVTDFAAEIDDFCMKLAATLADVREANGENRALTKEQYHEALRSYRDDVNSGRLQRPTEEFRPETAILSSLERRAWVCPSSETIAAESRKRKVLSAESVAMARVKGANVLVDTSEKSDVEVTAAATAAIPNSTQTLANASRKRWRIQNKDWITTRHLLDFCRLLWRKYNRALTEPGEAVGAIGAQSIGEPGTQMTLKTFHFAGVASMNVTLGVPRIKEIMNAARKIMTPIMQVPLKMNQRSFSFAQMVKGRLECTRLGQVASYVKQVLSPSGVWVVVKLSREVIQTSFLDIDAETVRLSILEQGTVGGMKLKENLVEAIPQQWKLIVRPPGGGKGLSFQLTALMEHLPDVRVSGLKTIRRTVVQKNTAKRPDGTEGPHYALACEGEGLQDVMTIDGVDGLHVKCNSVMEVMDVLGIEAARQTIISEIKGCMDAYSMNIDLRHMLLLGDVMTNRGEVLGISRFGIQKMRASVLSIASFEETNEHLFEAAIHKKSEHVQGVSEAIILGRRVALGTGSFELLHAPAGFEQRHHLKPPRKFMMATMTARRLRPNGPKGGTADELQPDGSGTKTSQSTQSPSTTPHRQVTFKTPD